MRIVHENLLERFGFKPLSNASRKLIVSPSLISLSTSSKVIRGSQSKRMLDELHAPQIVQMYYAFNLVFCIDDDQRRNLPLLKNR